MDPLLLPGTQAFHLRCLCRLLGITWQTRITNFDILAKTGMPSMFAILTQRRLHWLGHVTRMDNGRIPKGMLFRELATGIRTPSPPLQGCVQARPTCKRGGGEERQPLGRETSSKAASTAASTTPNTETGARLHLQ